MCLIAIYVKSWWFHVLYEANTSESSVFPVPLFDLKVDDVKVGMVNFLFEHFFFKFKRNKNSNNWILSRSMVSNTILGLLIAVVLDEKCKTFSFSLKLVFQRFLGLKRAFKWTFYNTNFSQNLVFKIFLGFKRAIKWSFYNLKLNFNDSLSQNLFFKYF